MSDVAVRDASISKATLGFWIYLMTDCVLFATLFATYAVLHTSTAGGPTTHELYKLPFVLGETLILLLSSFTCGVALLCAKAGMRRWTLVLFGLTFLLGAAFLVMELSEFIKLYAEGNSWRESAFLSSFFTLVGTHGLHIAVGMLWMVILLVQVVRRGINSNTLRRLTMLGMFWHFLDIIWIFIFTIVYMFGAAV